MMKLIPLMLLKNSRDRNAKTALMDGLRSPSTSW